MHYTGDSTFLPGPCQHNKKFACVFLPCAVPLFYIGGELYVYLSRYFDTSTKSQGGGEGTGFLLRFEVGGTNIAITGTKDGGGATILARSAKSGYM